MRFKVFAAAALLSGIAAHANQIAQYVSLAQGQDFLLTNTANVETLTATAIPVNFFWASALGLGTAPISATLTFNATTSASANTDASGNIMEGGWSGNFSFTQNGTGTNLLSGTFGPTGTLVGSGGSAAFSDSTVSNALSEVTYTSSVLNFSNTTERDFSFSLSNFSVVGDGAQNISVGSNGRPISGSYAGNATFAATPIPTTGIPEPATFALIGFGLLSAGMIHRRRA
jgi:hypothetical protein